MERDKHSFREELYSIIKHYAQLSSMARQGEVDPIGQIGQIIQKQFPFLLAVIGDLLPRLERDEITYFECLYAIIREAQRVEEQQILLDSRKEIGEIEAESRAFIYAVKWLDSRNNLRPGGEDLKNIQKTLYQLNKKYKKRYAPDADDTTTLIPYFFIKEESESEERSLSRIADVVQRAVLELTHLMIENEPERSFLIFTKSVRKDMENDQVRILGRPCGKRILQGFPVGLS
jgi:hypothetical protein